MDTLTRMTTDRPGCDMRLALKFLIAVCSALILAQFGVGFYGLWQNFWLLAIVVAAAFGLGYLGFEER